MRPTREETKTQIKHLPSDKAAGPDGITNRILQAGGEQAVDMIYMNMMIIWEVQTYPGAWALALMPPIYKSGGKDRHCPSSYRGIYLLNTRTKLFEELIESRLSQSTEKYDTRTSAQQGSRTSRQIHDAIYAHIATIQQNKQNGIPSYCCFVDFTTAYPSVYRTRLAPAPSKTTTSQERSGTFSKKTLEKCASGFSMHSQKTGTRLTFSEAYLRGANSAQPSLESVRLNSSRVTCQIPRPEV